MVFSSTVFLFLFLPLVVMIYYNPWKRTIGFRNGVLLVMSLYFYGYGEPDFVLVMILSILVQWFIGREIERSQCSADGKSSKRWLIAGVVFQVGLLFVFKYLTFGVHELGSLLGRDFSFVHIALPIGISFFSFQLLSYIFDVYYHNASAQKSVCQLGLYIALFPQLIAGPIVRYTQIAGELLGRRTTREDITSGMQRFIEGLAKKLLLANYLGSIADSVFGVMEHGGSISCLAAWLGAVTYTLQIYFDFSGYSDMAIGLGRIFGFHFSENFNYPYISKSATEFWRRWHISLGSWFRDYVYIPLGGNRVSRSRWLFNIFVVWALTGFWHGANWTFLCWGLIYFVLLTVEKLTVFPTKIGWLAHVYTMLAVTLAWVVFRSPSLEFAGTYIGCMFGQASFSDALFMRQLQDARVILPAAVLFALPWYSFMKEKLGTGYRVYGEPLLLLALFVVTLIDAVGTSYNPFIYFNF